MQIKGIKSFLFAKNMLILLTKKWAKTVACFRETDNSLKNKKHLRFFGHSQMTDIERTTK